MTDPQLFGRPSTNGSASWPPTATNTSSALARLDAPARHQRNRFDWKFFALAAVAVAIVVAVLFAFSAARAASPAAGQANATSPAASPRSTPRGFGLNRLHAPDLR